MQSINKLLSTQWVYTVCACTCVYVCVCVHVGDMTPHPPPYMPQELVVGLTWKLWLLPKPVCHQDSMHWWSMFMESVQGRIECRDVDRRPFLLAGKAPERIRATFIRPSGTFISLRFFEFLCQLLEVFSLHCGVRGTGAQWFLASAEKTELVLMTFLWFFFQTAGPQRTSSPLPPIDKKLLNEILPVV